MDRLRKEHSLMEHVLTLLKFADESNVDIETFIKMYEQGKVSLSLQSQEIWTAYEVIHFMDEMPGGFFIYQANKEERILYVNKALLRILKCDTIENFRELTGNSFRGLVFKEDLDRVEESIKEQIQHSQFDLDYVEYRIIRKDGTVGWLEDYGHFVRSEYVGDIFYVFVGDATEKKLRLQREKMRLLTEKHLKEQELQKIIDQHSKELKGINQEHLRRLEVIEGLSIHYETILHVDLDTNKVFPYRLSRRTEIQFQERIHNLEFDQFISEYAKMWVYEEDCERFLEATKAEFIRKKLKDNYTYQLNYRLKAAGEIQYMHLRMVDVGNKESISQIVLGAQAMDEEIRHEIEQRKSYEAALKNAKEANIAKNTFLSNMSHDMRTPLNAITGFTALAKKHINDGKKMGEYLEKIELFSDQLLCLINNVLDLSWMESEKVHIEKVECNLCDIMVGVQEDLHLQIIEKKVTVSLNFDALAHAEVYGDQEKLRQTILYLAGNAVKYTKPGGHVEIRVVELGQPGKDYADYQFIISDDGIGISDEFQKHIFEPFEREKNTTLSGVHGTGLGLTIAKSIVETMGGTIEVDSVLGKGSVFTVTIPLRYLGIQTLYDRGSEKDEIRPEDVNILLVEDNEINLEIEVELLQDMGFSVETAVNGSIAVNKIKNSTHGEYDLILMDIQMPVMDGYQASKAIRQLEDPMLANIPIIALSANAFEEDRRKSSESGINIHIAKPIDIQELLTEITKIVQNHSSSFA